MDLKNGAHQGGGRGCEALLCMEAYGKPAAPVFWVASILLEAERAPVKREVWSVAGLMSLQLVGGLLFARSSYLAPYRTVTGQFALCAFLAIFLGLVVRVQRLSRFPKPARFLTLRGGVR